MACPSYKITPDRSQFNSFEARFRRAWSACEQRSQCDAIDGVEYGRIFIAWMMAQFPPEIESFIIYEANGPFELDHGLS